MKKTSHAAWIAISIASSSGGIFSRNTAAGKYARYFKGRKLMKGSIESGSNVRGNMCPERKKLNSMYRNSSEETSRNQNPIIPMAASRKNPIMNPIMSEATKAQNTCGGGKPSKKSR